MSDSSSNAGSPGHILAMVLSAGTEPEAAAAVALSRTAGVDPAAHQAEAERSGAEASTSDGASAALDVQPHSQATRNPEP